MFNETTFLGTLDGDPCAQYLSQIYAAADRYGIDRGIALAQIRRESGCNPDAVGPSTRYGTAKGMAQFIDSTFAQYGSGSPFNPSNALDAWGQYMRHLLNQYNGDYSLALAAYNAGPGNVDKYGGVPPLSFAKGQTYNYVQAIMKALGIGGGAAPGGSQGDDSGNGDYVGSDTSTDPVDLFSGAGPWLGIAAVLAAAYFLLR